MDINVIKLKNMVKQRDKELYKLIASNKLDGDYTDATSLTINNWRNIWQLSITFVWGGIATGGTATIIKKPIISEKSKTKIWRIVVTVNPFRGEVANWVQRAVGIKVKPKSKHELELAAVESLMHELVHVQTLIGKTLPPDVPTSLITKNYKEALALAGRLGDSSAVVNKLKEMVALSGTAKTPKEVTTKAEEFFERLINEKFAASYASCAVGSCRDNHSIASSYAKMVGNMMRRDSKIIDNPVFEKVWENHLKSLTEALTILYKSLDKEKPPRTIERQ